MHLFDKTFLAANSLKMTQMNKKKDDKQAPKMSAQSSSSASLQILIRILKLSELRNNYSKIVLLSCYKIQFAVSWRHVDNNWTLKILFLIFPRLLKNINPWWLKIFVMIKYSWSSIRDKNTKIQYKGFLANLLIWFSFKVKSMKNNS